jgi:two-component system, OmpR family, response regulator
MLEKLTRVLYVEDELDIQMVARLALESLGGFTVEICSSGEEAIARVPVFKPQLILMDVMMPGMDGPAALKQLRSLPQFADTPIVFMTAKVQPGEVAGYKELGAIDVIAKPFDPMMLSGQVQAIWKRHHV